MTSNETVELTPRLCRWCGGRYVHPKGHSRAQAGCPKCQPSLFDVAAIAPPAGAKRV